MKIKIIFKDIHYSIDRLITYNNTSIATCLFLIFITSCTGYTPKIDSVNSVTSLEYITIGGIKQLVLIRGRDVSKPIILYLHGGPGTPAIPLAHTMRDLEKDFILIVWDQRGAGNSYNDDLTKNDYKIANYVKDTHELIEILINRFNKKKVFIIGHSWGSIIGMLYAQKYPEYLYAYIGIGQIINTRENENISYEYTFRKALESKNKKAINELKQIKPPYLDETNKLLIHDYLLEREWLAKFNGITCKKSDNPYGVDNSVFLKGKEYSLLDLLKIQKRSLESIKYLYNEQLTIDFFKQIPRLDVPVYFFIGRCDYNTPFEISFKYYERLIAPKGKNYIWFDNSGHVLILEEPDKFIKEVQKVLAVTYKE